MKKTGLMMGLLRMGKRKRRKKEQKKRVKITLLAPVSANMTTNHDCTHGMLRKKRGIISILDWWPDQPP